MLGEFPIGRTNIRVLKELLPDIAQYKPEEAELEFESWQDLIQTLSQHQSSHWVFRGHACHSWHLATSFERVLRRRDLSDKLDEVRAWEAASINHFSKFSKPFFDDVPPMEDYLGWLFKMQHYGAPTRLLDWTYSPFVALFFAYEVQVSDGQNGLADAALWMLNTRRCLQVHQVTDNSLSGYSVEGTQEQAFLRRDPLWMDRQNAIADNVSSLGLEFPLPVVAGNMDPRMIAQHAAFTFHGSIKTKSEFPTSKLWALPKDFEEDENSHFQRSPSYTIRRIRLRHEWRDVVLQLLSQMNVHAQSLFPGLDGAGKATKLYLDSIGERPGITKSLKLGESITLQDDCR